MSLVRFVSDNRIILAATAVGSAVVVAGVVIYANFEVDRQADRLFYDQQLSSIREELANLRSEVSVLRTLVKGVHSDAIESPFNNLSYESLRVSAGKSPTTNLDESTNRVPHIPSTLSLSSSGDYFDVLETFDNADSPMVMDGQLTQLFAKADELYEKANHQQAIYNELKEVYDMDESMRMNVEVLWRLARSCHAVANTYDNKNPSKKVILHEGRDYATRAYNLDPNSFEVLRWVAALTGSLTDFLGTQEKIEQGYLFKEYLDKAIAMQPSEYTLLHMRGRFSFSVANLSWFERKAAAALYTAPPQATIDDALEDFLEVEELEPGSWIENLYYLIKCFLIKKNKAEAVKYMKIALEIEPVDDAQTQMLAEIRRLLSKHS